MKISELGEFGFIDRIKEDTLFAPDSVVIGIGDDGAVYKTTEGMQQIAVIDTMVENCHFIIGKTGDWFDVGYKAVASNLSDIAAMGGIPTHIVLSTAISPDMEIDDLEALYKGIKGICRAYHVNILGGDTVTSREGLVITVAAFGEIEENGALRRSGAKIGDVVAVSNYVGDSAGGLDVLLKEADGYDVLARAHRFPQPRISLGRNLQKFHCHSLNDISDGLASEANEIAKASGVHIILDAELLPISSALRRWCKECNKRPRDFVLYGGEDYELIFTMAPEDFKAFRVSHPEVTAIGTVTSGLAGVSMMENGREVDVPPAGFHHFSEDK